MLASRSVGCFAAEFSSLFDSMNEVEGRATGLGATSIFFLNGKWRQDGKEEVGNFRLAYYRIEYWPTARGNKRLQQLDIPRSNVLGGWRGRSRLMHMQTTKLTKDYGKDDLQF